MTLLPAYGRDYKSRKAVEADFFAGKDFIIADLFSGEDGRYCSIHELKGEYKQVTLRYNQKRNLTVVKIPSK